MNPDLLALVKAVAITVVVMAMVTTGVSLWIGRIAQDCPDNDEWD